jgi:hypothetical protein
MYIVFILQFQKVQNNYQIMLKIAETSIILIAFNCVLCEVCDYTVTVFLPSLHELGTRKGISWSVNVYNKHLFSQCRIKHYAVSTEY